MQRGVLPAVVSTHPCMSLGDPLLEAAPVTFSCSENPSKKQVREEEPDYYSGWAEYFQGHLMKRNVSKGVNWSILKTLDSVLMKRNAECMA